MIDDLKHVGKTPMFDDLAPRYAPEMVMIGGYSNVPVICFRSYPAGQHPVTCPLVKDCCALELVTQHGSRWYGCERAYINSELRMVVVGTNSKDEVRRKWEFCNTP